MTRCYCRVAIVFCFFAFLGGLTRIAEAKSYLAYISDSPASASGYWVTKDAGFFKKHGLDVDLIFIDGSSRGIQTLIAGGIPLTSAVGTAVINGKLAGGDIAIINSLINTLPYYVFGKPEIKSPEDLKGRSAAMHIPGTAADFALRLALKGIGLSLKDIKGVTVGAAPARVAAVASGTARLHSGDRRGKDSWRKIPPQGGYRHGQAQYSVSVYLYGSHQADDSGKSRFGSAHGQGYGRSGPLLQKQQRPGREHHAEICARTESHLLRGGLRLQ